MELVMSIRIGSLFAVLVLPMYTYPTESWMTENLILSQFLLHRLDAFCVSFKQTKRGKVCRLRRANSCRMKRPVCRLRTDALTRQELTGILQDIWCCVLQPTYKPHRLRKVLQKQIPSGPIFVSDLPYKFRQHPEQPSSRAGLTG